MVKTATLYVPYLAVDDYKKSNTWKNWNISETTMTGIDNIKDDAYTEIQAIYDINGIRVYNPNKKGIYFYLMRSGKVHKKYLNDMNK